MLPLAQAFNLPCPINSTPQVEPYYWEEGGNPNVDWWAKVRHSLHFGGVKAVEGAEAIGEVRGEGSCCCADQPRLTSRGGRRLGLGCLLTGACTFVEADGRINAHEKSWRLHACCHPHGKYTAVCTFGMLTPSPGQCPRSLCATRQIAVCSSGSLRQVVC